jgi:dTDP-glucose 4,6-dehydratase
MASVRQGQFVAPMFNTVLVTGGLGFIGSNFILNFASTRQAQKIINLDSISYGAVRDNLSTLEQTASYQFVKGDVADSDVVKGLVRGSDAVVHFAAETHVDRSISNPEAFLHSNVLGTFTLLEAARTYDIGKFVHISTDEVYGSAEGTTTFHEGDRLSASSPYAASKAAAEMLVTAYHRTYGLDTVTLRCTNNFGPRQFPEKFIPKTIISALSGRKVPVYGSGMQIRDWVYVNDFCDAIRLALEKGTSGAIYNVSAGNELPNLDIAKSILTILGKPASLIQLVEDRPGHDFRYSIDSTQIREGLGWAPEHTLPEALRATVHWYTANESWWKPLLSEKLLSPTPWKEKW